jgi:hypothetical protein
MFPENYPQVPIVIELKSKALSERLLYGLSNVCEQEARKFIGQRQVCIHPSACRSITYSLLSKAL